MSPNDLTISDDEETARNDMLKKYAHVVLSHIYIYAYAIVDKMLCTSIIDIVLFVATIMDCVSTPSSGWNGAINRSFRHMLGDTFGANFHVLYTSWHKPCIGIRCLAPLVPFQATLLDLASLESFDGRVTSCLGTSNSPSMLRVESHQKSQRLAG